MDLGIRLQNDPHDVGVILRRAARADALGFHSVWLGDHLMWPRVAEPMHAAVDSWTVMSAVGARTERAKLGFAMLNPSFRAPALLAKQLATLDQVTDGRVICSLGAGYYVPEYRGYGIPFIADHDARVAHEREVALLCRTLWTEPSPVSFAGEYVQVEECWFWPPPVQQPHPPFWFGGNSDATRALVRELGDGWLTHIQTAEGHLAWVRAQADWPTRPITYGAMGNVCIAASRDAAAEKALRGLTPNPREMTPEEMLRWCILGTPEDCIRRFAEMAAWGVGFFYATVDGEETFALLAREVLPAVAALAPAPTHPASARPTTVA
jgi:alkanesulfonate monooxygenase SsuD/methylene tetrahydromethanopterin reductase-like flavin-dependent oxidoreductase (luciferase family)